MAKAPLWLTSPDSRFWPALGRVASVFGVITPIGAIVTYFITGTFGAPAMIIAIYLCVLVTVLIALLLRQESRYLREVRYAAAMLPLQRAFTELSRASWGLYYDDASEEAFRLRLREALRRLAEAFSLTTGTQCRACIKLLQAPNEAPEYQDFTVQTLCRDTEEREPPTHTPDRVCDNTDFSQIFEENKVGFFSNDLVSLARRGHYRNSHWNPDDIERGTLDYHATIVWPIERGQPARNTNTGHRELLGFLCVDTKAKGAFVKTYDDALGASFAHALYLAIHRFQTGQADTA